MASIVSFAERKQQCSSLQQRSATDDESTVASRLCACNEFIETELPTTKAALGMLATRTGKQSAPTFKRSFWMTHLRHVPKKFNLERTS